jgi:hypothetical protein
VRQNTKEEEVINKKAKVWLPNTNAMPILFSCNKLNEVFFIVLLVSLVSKFISKYYFKLPFVVTEKIKVSMTDCLLFSHLIYAYERGGADKSLARAVIKFFYPARQGTEGNSRHSERNIRGTCTILCHRQKLGGPV